MLKRSMMTTDDLQTEIQSLITQKNFPCIAAVKALHQNEIRIGTYQDFGQCRSWQRLREDLFKFSEEQRKSQSEHLTFWAVFEGESNFSEDEFEEGLWRELSSLTSIEDKATDWNINNSDPASSEFSFCLFGEPFFVVGIHPNSSRRGRRFSKPSLIFNLFRQFDSLGKKGVYESMVKAIRARELKFDGAVNPMTLAHGDDWEAIQFSGKPNPSEWKCPFHFLFKREKK